MATIYGENGTLEILREEIVEQGPFTAPATPYGLSDLSVTVVIRPETLERVRQRLMDALAAANREGQALIAANSRLGALAAQARPVILAEPFIGDPATCTCMLCQAARGWPRIETAPPTDAEAEASLQEVLHRCAPIEILAVRDALRAGAFEGAYSTACLLGIVARCRGISYPQLKFEWGRTNIEEWVIAHVHAGMTPATDPRAALLDAWLTAYLEAHTLELPTDAPPAPAEEWTTWDTPVRGVSIADVIGIRQRVFRQRFEAVVAPDVSFSVVQLE